MQAPIDSNLALEYKMKMLRKKRGKSNPTKTPTVVLSFLSGIIESQC